MAIKRPRTSVLIVLAVAVVLVASGVTAYFHARLLPGPLAPNTVTALCLPRDKASVFAVGIDLARPKNDAVQIQNVTALDVSGTNVLGYRLLHVTGDGVALQPYPPNDASQVAEWRNQVPAAGAATRGNGWYQLIAEVRPTKFRSEVSSIGGFQIDYSSGGVDYTLKTGPRVDLPATRCN